MRYLLIFLLLQTGFVYAQEAQEEVLSEAQVQINSIKKILKREKRKLHDTVAVDYYRQLAKYSSDELDYGSAVLYCDSVLQGYPDIDFYLLKEVEEEKANYLKEDGNTKEAIEIMLAILSQFEDRQDYEESGKLNKRIGVIFLKMDDLQNAEYHLEESIEYARKAGDKETEGYSLMSLGNRFKKEQRFEEAEKNYLSSIEIAEEINDQRLLAGNYNNYGSLYRLMDQPDEAMKYYKMAVAINKKIGNDKWLSYNYNNLGNIYKARQQYGEALRYFFLSMEIKDKLDDIRGKVYTLQNIASVYELQGNFPQAYKFQKDYSDLKDSLSRLDNADETKMLAAKFQSERREAEIIQLNMQGELNKQEIKARDERINYQKFLGILMILGFVLIIAIALMLWRSVVNRKKVNQELWSKNQQIDEQHREIIDSINYAKRIQNSILPGKERLNSILGKYALLYKPKDIISGDFYICDKAHDMIYFGTVDCTGHGVPGAMVSLVASSNLNKTIHELNISDPGDILNKLKIAVPDALAVEDEEINDGMDMSLCAISSDKKRLKFAGAYQNCWVLNTKEKAVQRSLEGVNHILHEGGSHSVIELRGDRFGIGKSTSSSDFHTQTIDLVEGDMILLSTDGYQDQFGGADNKKFKVKAMRELVLEHGGESSQQLIETLEKSLKVWQGENEQVDDICIMIIEI